MPRILAEPKLWWLGLRASVRQMPSHGLTHVQFSMQALYGVTLRLIPHDLIASILPMYWRLDDLQHAVTFERAAVTPRSFVTIFIPAFFSYYVMAVLVQLPRTRFYRAALLPAVLWVTFGPTCYAYLNQVLALSMFTAAVRSTAWLFAKQPYTRLPVSKSGNGTVNGHNVDASIKHRVSVSSAMWDACDLIVNLRGIGWIGPPRTHIPTRYLKVESRPIFALLCLCQVAFFTLAFDTLCLAAHALGPDTFGTPKGGTIFDPSLPPMKRHLMSLIITLLSGTTVYVMVEAIYNLHAALFTILFQQYPSQWPPLLDSPWLSTSLTSFWGRRWHQLFREYFVVLGSKPVERYLGRAGIVMGAFAVSGILHDVGMQGMGRGADTLPVVGFFIVHGVGVVMEHAWKQATGKRVGGIIGWSWMCFWFALWGPAVVDVWARRGLVGSKFFPEDYRPTTLFLKLIHA